MLSLLSTDITLFIIVFVALLVSIACHEAAHAYVAHWLGDNTPESEGRLTFDPLAHLDPIGTICLLIFGFGWGKPVNINPNNFRRLVRDDILVSVAGPLTNILLAVVFALLSRLIPDTSLLYSAVIQIVFINVILAFFNLLPIPPLDGFSFIALIVGQDTMYRIKSFGSFMLIGLLIVLNIVPAVSNGFFNFVELIVGFLAG